MNIFPYDTIYKPIFLNTFLQNKVHDHLSVVLNRNHDQSQ